MRKTIILALAALMLLTAQCKKNEQKPEEMVMVPITGTVTFGGNSKTDITTWGHITPVYGDKIWIYNNGIYKGYMKCRPTTGQQFNCAGEIDPECLGKECVFMYLGTDSKEANGTTDISETSSTITFAEQTGIRVSGDYFTGLNKFHVGSCTAAVSSEGTVVLPMRTKMAVAYFQLVDENNPSTKIANADVAISGHYNTATINKTDGTLSGNTEGDITVHTDANGCFYMALIPQSGEVDFTFAVINYDDGTNTFPNGINENSLYSQQGSGNPIVVPLGYSGPDNPSRVTTVAGCSSENIYTMGGTVTLTDAQQVEYGFVYSQKDKVPEVGRPNCIKFEGNTESLPVGTKSFTIDLTGLTTGVTYYVRAYAIGESGTVVYAPSSSEGIKTVVGGNVPQPLPSDWIEGVNPHPFTVKSGTTVKFSQGNLQYIGGTRTWKFADHQFDFLGNNGQNSATETVDRDLFGWGTSGQAHGATCYQPWSTSTNYTQYHAYGDKLKHLYSQTPATADWGYNAISNGGNETNSGWRTLTREEWAYLFNTRPNASKLYGHGKVGSCQTNGMIILPDDWRCPTGLSFTPGNSAWSNVYSYPDWSKMEAAGAVFLPAAGFRRETVQHVGSVGSYWSSSYYIDTHKVYNDAYGLGFQSNGVDPQYHEGDRCDAFSVRLVR